MQSPETSVLQKGIIILFALTILLSCISLVWIAIEKPDKINKVCNSDSPIYNEPIVSENSLKSVISGNCTTTVNPSMSNGLTTTIDIATFSGFLFLSASLYAGWDRWKNRPIP